MPIYKINEDLVDTLMSNISKIERKCKKYGFPFKAEVVGEEIVPSPKNKTNQYIKRILIDIEGTVKIEGWEFIALLENCNGVNIIKGAKDNIQIPELYKTRHICDHCNTKRNRVSTILIRNTTTGEYKQVGRQCISDYIGKSAEQYAAYIEFVKGVQDLEYESFSDNINVSRSYFLTIDVISYAIKNIKQYGYVPTVISFRDAETKDPTATKVYSDLVDRHSDMYSKEDKEEAEAVIEWAKHIDGSDNSYYHNIQTILSNKYISSNNLGIAVSAVPAKYKYDSKKAEQAALKQYKLPENINIGDKITLSNVKIREAWSGDLYYGYTYLYKIISNNSVYVWWTSKDLCLEDYPNGELTADVNGTVKQFDEHDNVPQVVLTRCKIVAHN